VLTNPVYAGAYAFGKTRCERYVDEHGHPRQRIRHLPRADWEILIWEHHLGFVDRATFEANQQRVARNTRPRAHEPGGAVREGAALLQGIAVCGRCGRKLKVHYRVACPLTAPARDRDRGRVSLAVAGGLPSAAVAESQYGPGAARTRPRWPAPPPRSSTGASSESSSTPATRRSHARGSRTGPAPEGASGAEKLRNAAALRSAATIAAGGPCSSTPSV
jgi:hypothetical protein